MDLNTVWFILVGILFTGYAAVVLIYASLPGTPAPMAAW